MQITLPIEPPRCTAQHKGERVVGRFIRHYEKAPQRKARIRYLAEIKKAMAGRTPDYNVLTDKGDAAPLIVTICFAFRANRQHKPGTMKTTRPDVDNMAKGLIDCLSQAALIGDDAQIARLTLEKTYAVDPHVTITIRNA